MRNTEIRSWQVFDWGRASADYAKYRDIYPQEFYQKILDLELCQAGQKVLDLGTARESFREPVSVRERILPVSTFRRIRSGRRRSWRKRDA